MEIEEIENGIKATVPLITEDDIKVINNDFDGIVSKFSKMIIKEKDLANAQYIIKKQQEQIKELERTSIPKKKIEEKLDKLGKEYKEELEKNSIKAFILKCQIEILQDLLEEK